jgi:hypothetical protein
MVSIVVMTENGIDIYKWNRRYNSDNIERYLVRQYPERDREQIQWQAYPDEVPIRVR